jgi:transposase
MSRLSEALADNHRLRQENARLEKALLAQQQQVVYLSEQNRKLKRQVWGQKSERSGAEKKTPAESGRPRPTKTSDQHKRPVRHGPKPFDPALPRVKIKLPDPAPQDLICPVTGELMHPGFTERIEVMEFIPAAVVIRQLERTWFVSHAKSAPVATPWPDDVFARSRVHASVFGHLAAEHYCEHAPFARIEKKWERAGLRLPRATQVSLMQQMEQTVQPVVTALKTSLMQKDYLHLDPTPVRLCDPARPGGTVEATIWGYRAKDEPLCWFQFEYERGKSPDHPHRELTAANFKGHLQVDGAAGLSDIGIKGQVIALGCLAHCRRYSFQAVADGDQRGEVYLAGFNKIFKIDRISRRFRFDVARQHEWRLRYSLPIFDLLVAMAEGEIAEVMPKTLLWDSLHYLIAQQEYLRRCIITPGAELTNNAAERNLRPLKCGLKNWLFIGHPKAGPRLANLFTLAENCRQLGLNVEAYITDLVTRLPGHPAKKIAELLPAAWKRAQEKLLAAVDPPAA